MSQNPEQFIHPGYGAALAFAIVSTLLEIAAANGHDWLKPVANVGY